MSIKIKPNIYPSDSQWSLAIKTCRDICGGCSDSDYGCTHRKYWNSEDSGVQFCRDCGALYNSNSHCCASEGSKGYLIGPEDKRIMIAVRDKEHDNKYWPFMKFLTVHVSITAPLYWWNDYGERCDFSSAMIFNKPFTLEDFSDEHLISPAGIPDHACDDPIWMLNETIKCLNDWREAYLKTGDWICWWQVTQLLPIIYNFTQTLIFDYLKLMRIYKVKKDSMLDEWRDFCKWIEELPFSELITGGEE